jgi:hypothetical protein
MQDINDVIIDIQDHLVPILDTYEQAIYHYIFRHTFLIGKHSTLFSTKRAEIGLGSGAAGTPPSEASRSKKLRSLEAKGAIKILERSHRGIEVAILLPREMPNLITTPELESIDLETLDFYKDRKLMPSILEREGYRCFYTGKKISEDNCYLDHVIAQAAGGDNSYRNIVAASYDANSMKNDKKVDDFIRELYKNDLLSLSEFNELKQKIVDLQNGKLLPNEHMVQEAISS